MLKDNIAVARGLKQADLVIKRAKVVNVFTNAIESCDVAVNDGKIVGLGDYSSNNEIDARGEYLFPSFIDSHVHIESSMLTPIEYAKCVVPKGVTCIIADPHEIANVCGEDGIKYIIDCGAGLPLDIITMLPSCVPASPNDQSNAHFDGDKTAELFSKYRFGGLGEMMDSYSVLNGDIDTLQKIESAPFVDGHAPCLSGKDLCAYLSANISTDHECTTKEEAYEKIGRGMYVQVREGTSARNLDSLIGIANQYTARRMMFCTDDKHLDHIEKYGTISNCVKRAVANGVEPTLALIMASYNVAQCYRLPKRGAIAPGYMADFIISEDLTAQNIRFVFKNGVMVARDGEALFDKEFLPSEAVLNTVRVREVTPADFDKKFDKTIPAIGVAPNTLITSKVYCDSDEGLAKCAVVARHDYSNRIGNAFAYGFGLIKGSVAQSIGHDSHNITVLGDNPSDMALAVNALGSEGGIAVVIDGKLASKMSLPIAGLIARLPFREGIKEYVKVKNTVKGMTPDSGIDTLMMMSFLSLSVIPELRITDKGLFDCASQKFID